MKSLRFLDRRVGSSLAAFGLLLGLVVPAAVPAFASADVLTARSVALSSSKADDSSVSYTISFKTVQAALAGVIEFCSNTPIPGQTCTAPSGLDLHTATVASSTPTTTKAALTAPADNVTELAGTWGADTTVTVELTGVHNPTAVGTFYARIVTYDTVAHALAYTTPAVGTGAEDQGGVALATTNAIGVSASVRESLTFCVANAAIGDGCTGTSGHDPNLVLGEDDGSGTRALSTSTPSTGDIFTQISTNAASGAVVTLKSNATGCGGLVRQGAATNNCNIAPMTTVGTIDNTTANFGVKATADTDGTGAFGTFQAVGDYATNYYMNYVSGDATGVTSTYGDPILNTGSGPAGNKNMKLTFAASATPQTPAGNYKANLNLIATGTY